MLFRPRYLRRYRRIAEVMARHGFGAIVTQLGLGGALDLPSRILRRDYEPATERTAAIHLRLALEELGPTFIKLGQIASTRPEILPPEFLFELANLQDNVPPAPWEETQPYLEEELGAPLEEIFLAFDPTAIASASLAQVYDALLPDRTHVVVKVQRPGIEETIETDLAILRDLARLAQERLSAAALYDPIGLADEFSAALRLELDYNREGRNTDSFRENFKDESYVYVPKVYWKYTSRRILVLERIEGIKIDNIEGLDEAGYDREKISLNAARLFIKEVLEDGFFHADPHPGNMLIMPDEVLGLMDFGTMGFLDNHDRSDLVRLYIAVIRFDTDSIVEQLIRMGIAGPTIDEMALQRDLRRLLRKYQGMPLKDINANEMLGEIQPLIYEYRLKVPSDYLLLIKTLVLMEGVGKKVAPDFDVFAMSAPFVSRFLLRLASPTSWGPTLLSGVAGWVDLVGTFPRQTQRIMSRVERGEMEFKVQVPDISESTKLMNQMANRVVLAVLVGAFTVALALLIPTLDLNWPWSLVTWLIVLGFFFIVGLGFWLMLSILRSNRRR
jgi:ubiquinone biosynthesis protein